MFRFCCFSIGVGRGAACLAPTLVCCWAVRSFSGFVRRLLWMRRWLSGVIGCYGARLFDVLAGFGVAWFYFRCALFVVVGVGGSLRAWFVWARV